MTKEASLVIGALIGIAMWWIIDRASGVVAKIIIRRQHPGRICARRGHDWRSYGGRNAGCCRDCSCSIPVHECARCGDCDYGDNAEAARTIERCPIAAEVRSCICQGGYDQPGDIAYRCNDCPVHGEPA